jgi:hypothetical protein
VFEREKRMRKAFRPIGFAAGALPPLGNEEGIRQALRAKSFAAGALPPLVRE